MLLTLASQRQPESVSGGRFCRHLESADTSDEVDHRQSQVEGVAGSGESR
jgi:hypothetical protein